jgi:hypothetical protein
MVLAPRHIRDRNDRLEEAVVAYFEAVESGHTPDRSQWAARYPELAAELAEFFANQDQVDSWTAPLREVALAPSTEHRDPNRTQAGRLLLVADIALPGPCVRCQRGRDFGGSS